MGIIRFNGARSIDRDERVGGAARRVPQHPASMGPGRLTGMNAYCLPTFVPWSTPLQWGPVD